MKQPSDVRALLERRFASAHRDWLHGADGAPWPMVIGLGIPTEQQAMREVDAVRAWAAAWRDFAGAGQLGWISRQWKVLGTQQLPATLTLQGPADVAHWIGERERWERAVARGARLTARWPQLAGGAGNNTGKNPGRLAGRLFGALADYDDADFSRLLNMLAWLEANPQSGLYPRQLPVAGVDSKWIENRQAVLGPLAAGLSGCAEPAVDFYQLCGLKRPPALVRMRILDPSLRARAGGLGDFAAPVADLARLSLAPPTVLIVENLQTALALGDIPGAVVLMALGYGVDQLAHIAWIAQARCIYWGDIDTHGLAILSRARSYLPMLESVLMDEATLRGHAALWSDEKAQHAAESMPQLNRDEASVYRLLKQNVLGHQVRLEQERLEWGYACAVLRRHIG